ncbi:hypothetical protein E2562_001266 [Oryza meyeriana var. granulata]|uniref:F-box domain-containing protein n=1 Tax=Oryza meyeriana var. granulata TaxID=110450 RepID=A0A6G1DCW7_9ORYZ|nr:hypothetical protein E2562_001266 [Oryza meyeriana var. granulata]
MGDCHRKQTDMRREGMEPQEEGPTLLLPDDALAEVLRRLPARDLAVSRCACTAGSSSRARWEESSCTSTTTTPGSSSPARRRGRPSAASSATCTTATIYDHCNGLLLSNGCVVNPATPEVGALAPALSPIHGYQIPPLQ